MSGFLMQGMSRWWVSLEWVFEVGRRFKVLSRELLTPSSFLARIWLAG